MVNHVLILSASKGLSMNPTLERLATVKSRIAAAEAQAKRDKGAVTLVAVSKTFEADHIRPVLASGHKVFGENRVQEAQGKWPALKAEYPGVELHLIGPLQSNKVKEAVELFDVIETVDREKIAAALSAEMKRQNRHPKLFVQVNTGLEPQKAGIAPRDCTAFVERCRAIHGLIIEGLMCIPPADENPGPHFELLGKLAGQCGVKLISMGMSADYEPAIALGATHVRVGSGVFGVRDYPD
jgi:PLP dependent protein